MRWNDDCSSFPDTHVLKAHVHPHHHLSRSQNYVVGLAKTVSGVGIGKKKTKKPTLNIQQRISVIQNYRRNSDF